MKNFFLAMSLATTISVSFASVPPRTEGLSLPQTIKLNKSQNQVHQLSNEPTSLSEMLLNLKKGISPSKTTARSVDELIYDIPEGENRLYSGSGFSFSLTWTGLSLSYMSGVAKEIVFSDDAIYVKNPFMSFSTNTYLKADYNDGKYTVSLPVMIYEEMGYDGNLYSYYAQILDRQDTEDGNVNYVPSDETEMSFIIEDGKVILDLGYNPVPDENGYISVPDKIFALTDSDGNWTGIGDGSQEYAVFSEEVLTPPAEMNTEKWAFVYDDTGRFIEIGFEGDNIWFKNLYTPIPEAWIKGTVSGNEIEIPSFQYLGVSSGYFTYLLTVNIDENDNLAVCPSMIMNYDRENKVIETKSQYDVLMFNAGKETIGYLSYLTAPKFRLQPADINPQVQNPRDLAFYDYYAQVGMAFFDFTLPIFNVDGELLNTDNLYYNVLIDGDVWTFYNDEYPNDVEDEITDIPFNLGVQYFWGDGTGKKEIVIFATGISTIGVQLFNKANGEIYKSEVVTLNLSDGVEENLANYEISSEEWYDISGRRIITPNQGIFIKKVILSDGTVKTIKIAK